MASSPIGHLLVVVAIGVSPGALGQTPTGLYAKHCAVCHLPGIAGAPKVGDTIEWSRRVRPGLNLVHLNALQGMPNTAMLAKGGQPNLGEGELRAIVAYMISAANLGPDVLREAARYDALGIVNRDFIRLDANFDGYLSRDEIAADATLAQNLARFDADKDGRLSVAEYENAEVALERERMAVRTDDRVLVDAVRAAIARVKGIDAASTKVESVGGTVAMAGIVEDAEAARRAHDAVKRIPGVQKIDNRLVSGHQMGWD